MEIEVGVKGKERKVFIFVGDSLFIATFVRALLPYRSICELSQLSGVSNEQVL